MQKLIIYKASAGSGKTYKITEEYLRLAFRIPFYHILAVTFTNKATAEMKDRITGALDSLAKGRDSSYLKILMEDSGMEEAAVRKKAGMLVDEILQNYSRFSVGTIDSFFQRVIRGFARETGLQSGFELELDNSRVLDKVIDRLMIETSTNSGLMKWLMRYADGRIREGHSWNFRQDIGRLGTQVFNETFMEFRKEMTEKLSDREFMNSYMASLYAVRDDFEKQMSGFGTAGLAFMDQRGLTVNDFIYGSKGVAGYFEKIASGKQFEPGKRVLDAVSDPEVWCTKKSAKKDEIIQAVQGGLNRVLNQALELYGNSYPSYISSRLVLSNFYTLGILNDITRNIREYASENNLFLLSDVASLLAGIIGSNDAPFVYEKTGHFFRHFMIDEFQDTSAIQWKNFVPLISNSLAENNRNILVGDVKQSIYRWRNGDWRILANGIQEDMKIFTPQVRTLEVNWRSKMNIVQFNNSLFSYGPDIIREQFRKEYTEAGLPEDFASDMTAQIGNAYAEHAQELPSGEEKDGGYIKVSFLENDNGKWRQNVTGNLPALIAGVRLRGYRLRDIAILVRNKRDGNQIARALLDWQSEYGIEDGGSLDFISEEFLLLQESSSVRLILALLDHLVDPSVRITRAVILNEYCRYLQCQPDERLTDHNLFGSIDASGDSWAENLLPEEFISRKESLRHLSLYELVEQLIAIFGLHDKGSGIPYLMAFQDVVLDFSRKEGGGTGPFLEWWEEHCSTLSVSSNDRQDALRIMTIHKAKGLQFKVVLIPFAEWNIDHNPLHDNFLWCRPIMKPFDRLDLVPVKYKSELAGSIFARDYFNEKMQVFVDNLNLLYVAFTRAEEEFHVFAPLPGEKQRDADQVKNIQGLLYRILSAGLPVDNAAYHGGAQKDPSADGFRQTDPSAEDARQVDTGAPGYRPDDAGTSGDGQKKPADGDRHVDTGAAGDLQPDTSAAGFRQTGVAKSGAESDNMDDTTGHLIDNASQIINSEVSGGQWNDQQKTFTLGNPGISSGVEVPAGNEMLPENYHVNFFKDKLRLRPYGNLFFSDDQDIGKRIDHGKLMHEIFEGIITTKDIAKAVMQKSHAGIITREEAGEMIRTITAITGKKEVSHWFDGSWMVRNETAILLRGGKTRRPDRVMIREGKVVVVDYKFGENVQPRYRNQVRRYMNELKQMGHTNLKGYVWYPLSGIIDEVDMINPELEFE
jgi:ATP-dependent helicase/nuclease subunit A